MGAKQKKIMGFFDLFKKKKDNTAPAAPEQQEVAQEEAQKVQEQQEELQRAQEEGIVDGDAGVSVRTAEFARDAIVVYCKKKIC